MKVRRLGRRDMIELLRLPPMCVADWLGEFISSAPLKAALARPAVAGDFLGPWSPGSTATLLLAEAAAGPGVEGGGGTIAAALEKAARAAGVTSGPAPAWRDHPRQGRRDRRQARRRRARHRQPDRHLLPPAHRLPRPPAARRDHLRLRERIANFRSRGTTAQVLLAVDKPIELPDGAGAGPHRRPRQRHRARLRRHRAPPPVPRRRRPRGRHPLGVGPGARPGRRQRGLGPWSFASYQVDGGWTEAAREKLARRVVEVLDRRLPGLRPSVVGSAVLAAISRPATGWSAATSTTASTGSISCWSGPSPNASATGPRSPASICAAAGPTPGGGLTCAPASWPPGRSWPPDSGDHSMVSWLTLPDDTDGAELAVVLDRAGQRP